MALESQGFFLPEPLQILGRRKPPNKSVTGTAEKEILSVWGSPGGLALVQLYQQLEMPKCLQRKLEGSWGGAGKGPQGAWQKEDGRASLKLE